MDRFECNGYLRVTMIDKNTTLAGITITHHRSHCPYVVSVPDKVESIIQEMINMPASKVSFDSLSCSILTGLITLKFSQSSNRKRKEN